MRTDFAKELGHLTLDAELTHLKLAKLLGLAHDSVDSWFAGKSMPNRENLDKLIELFGEAETRKLVAIWDKAKDKVINAYFQDNLRTLMRIMDMEDSEVAAVLDCPVIHVRSLRYGEARPRKKELDLIASIFHIDGDDLLKADLISIKLRTTKRGVINVQ